LRRSDDSLAIRRFVRSRRVRSTITAKGQTAVPRQVLERIGAGRGTRLVWHVIPNGSLIVRAKTRSLLDLGGSLKAPDGKRVAIKDMNGWR
jgi:antitoxin PrlF